jgi:hypothetical protein
MIPTVVKIKVINFYIILLASSLVLTTIEPMKEKFFYQAANLF